MFRTARYNQTGLAIDVTYSYVILMNRSAHICPVLVLEKHSIPLIDEEVCKETVIFSSICLCLSFIFLSSLKPIDIILINIILQQCAFIIIIIIIIINAIFASLDWH